MPFHQPFPRSFQPASIQTYAPATSGVFGISNRREWLYIGESSNIRAALFHLLAECGAPRTEDGVTGFVFEVADASTRARRYLRLMEEYRPTSQWPGMR